MFLLNEEGRVLRTHYGFEKSALNTFAADLGCVRVAEEFDGVPSSKPGCMSRHLEPLSDGVGATAVSDSRRVEASRIELADSEDIFE
jgi:hypothetical protein